MDGAEDNPRFCREAIAKQSITGNSNILSSFG